MNYQVKDFTTLIELCIFFKHQNTKNNSILISSILIYHYYLNIPDFDIKVYSVNKTETFIRTNLKYVIY